MKPEEAFEIAREQVRHEDGLVNSRITWLQVFQGLLFTAFMSGLGLFKEQVITSYPGAKTAIAVGLCILALLGMLSSFVAYKAVSSAVEQLVSIEKWWNDTNPPPEFPKLAGEHGFKLWGIKILGAHVLLAFAVAWILFIGLFLHVALC